MRRIFKFFNWKVRTLLLVVLVTGLIGFTEVSQSGIICKSIKVDIQNDIDNHFLGIDDVTNIILAQGERNVLGQSLDNLDLKSLETELEENPYIETGEIFKDLEGNLLVTVELRRPIARILRTSGPDAYITAKGEIMPVSEKFVSRVMLIYGSMSNQMVKPEFFIEEYGTDLLEMINFIDKNEFWRAQVADLNILRNGKIEILPQVTKQKIEFGLPENVQDKFKKLKIFYNTVLPTKGWNTYERVNLEFKDQIIAE